MKHRTENMTEAELKALPEGSVVKTYGREGQAMAEKLNDNWWYIRGEIWSLTGLLILSEDGIELAHTPDTVGRL